MTEQRKIYKSYDYTFLRMDIWMSVIGMDTLYFLFLHHSASGTQDFQSSNTVEMVFGSVNNHKLLTLLAVSFKQHT